MRCKLKDLGFVSTGNTPSKSNEAFYDSDDIGFVKPDILSDSSITETIEVSEYLSENARSKARIVKDGAVFVTCIGSIGKVGVADGEYAFNQQINAIQPNEKVRSKYLAYCMLYNKKVLQVIANAPVVPIINKSQFEEFELEIEEDINEQTRIVEILDKVNGVLESRKRELQELDNLIKSRFVEMFGDPVQNSKGWEIKALLNMGICKNGMNFHYNDSGVEINCLGVGDFKDLSIIEDTSILPIVSLNEMPSKDYLLQDGDIVFVRSNGNKALVGRSLAVYPGAVPTTFSGFCIRYRKTDDAIRIPYLLRVLKSDSMRNKMVGRGANIQNLNQQVLGTLIIPVPPIELQIQFEEFVQQIDKLKVEVQKSLNETQKLMDSLMQQYFG